jgi:hypothetical protein
VKLLKSKKGKRTVLSLCAYPALDVTAPGYGHKSSRIKYQMLHMPRIIDRPAAENYLDAARGGPFRFEGDADERKKRFPIPARRFQGR